MNFYVISDGELKRDYFCTMKDDVFDVKKVVSDFLFSVYRDREKHERNTLPFDIE